MPRRSDVPYLNEALACEVAGIAPAKRKDWIDRGLIDQPRTRAKLTEWPVVQLALVQELHHVLGPRDGGIAWMELRKLLKDQIPARQLDLVFDHRFAKVSLVTNEAALAEAVRVKRKVTVIALGGLIAEVRDGFRRKSNAPVGPARDRAQRQRRRA